MNPLFGAPLTHKHAAYGLCKPLPLLDYTEEDQRIMRCVSKVWLKMLGPRSLHSGIETPRITYLPLGYDDLQIKFVKDTEIMMATLSKSKAVYVFDNDFGQGEFHPWMNLFVKYGEQILNETAVRYRIRYNSRFHAKNPEELLRELEIKIDSKSF